MAKLAGAKDATFTGYQEPGQSQDSRQEIEALTQKIENLSDDLSSCRREIEEL